MTRISALGDLHENFHLPPPREADLFLFAGDFFARKHTDWQDEVLRQYHKLPELGSWLRAVPARQIFFVAGNHDYIFRALGERTVNYWLGQEGIPATYLEDAFGEYKGLSIWGTPWVSSSPDGKFPLSSAFVLGVDAYREKTSLPSADIILSHNSPWYDFPSSRENFLDSPAAAQHLRSEIIRTEPQVLVSGHFHWMRGRRRIGQTQSLVPSATRPYLPEEAPYGLVSGDPYLYFSL